MTASIGSHHIVVSQDEPTGIATVRLNRPEVGNALDLSTAAGLAAAVDHVASWGGLRVLLLTAAGERFCVGGDVKAFTGVGEQRASAYISDVADHLHHAVLSLERLRVPIVAGVQGSAAGAGLALVLAADIVLCTPDSRFRVAYTSIGLTPDGGASWRLGRLLGERRARELAILDPILDAEDAVSMGIASRIVATSGSEPDADLDAELWAVARRLADAPRAAIASTRELIRGAASNDLSTHLDLEKSLLVEAAGGPEGREGLLAFAERRRPRFR